MSEIPHDELRALVSACLDPQQPSNVQRAAAVVEHWLGQPVKTEFLVKIKTVPVAIMVAVDSAGNYEAVGATETDKIEADLLDELRFYTSHQQPAHVCLVRADVPMPSAIVVQGEVAK